MKAPALVFLSAALALSACGANVRQMTAGARDYADYRASRVAPSVPERLRRASYYLEQHPEGAFHDEVASWFARVERLFYEASADSPEGMESYLAALPNGPHAPSAAQRRDAFRDKAKIEAGERLAAQAAAFERRLAAAAQSREDVLTAYASWIRRLVDFDGWGRPLFAADDAETTPSTSELRKAWLEGASPRCSADRCSKLLEIPYELEVAGKPEPFECIIEISFALSAGRVVDAAVSGPDLFARLSEAQHAEPISRDPESRRRAVAFAANFTSGAIERTLPRVRCERDPTPPAAMLRDCDGLRFEFFPKATNDDDDRVVIRGPAGL
jgi:hypothetical protein